MRRTANNHREDCSCTWCIPASDNLPQRFWAKVKIGEGCYGRVCRHCGSTGPMLQIDHIIPVSRCGSKALDNLQVLCGSCNVRKGNRIGFMPATDELSA